MRLPWDASILELVTSPLGRQKKGCTQIRLQSAKPMLDVLNRGAAAQVSLGRSVGASIWSETDHFLCAGLIRLHILGRAANGPVFGLELMESLAEQGLRVSPGTLYPILHAFEARGLLKSTSQRSGKHARTVYRATPAGWKALQAAKRKAHELIGQLFNKK